MILSRVRFGNTAAIHRCIGSGTIVYRTLGFGSVKA